MNIHWIGLAPLTFKTNVAARRLYLFPCHLPVSALFTNH
jgi:hypothetical protein